MLFNPQQYDINCAIRVKTQNQEQILLKALDAFGKTWKSGNRYTERTPFTSKRWVERIYYFNRGELDIRTSAHNWYGGEIIEFDSFDWTGFEDADISDSDVDAFVDSFIGGVMYKI